MTSTAIHPIVKLLIFALVFADAGILHGSLVPCHPYASTLAGDPLPPLFFIGSPMIVAPRAGSFDTCAKFSNPGRLDPRITWRQGRKGVRALDCCIKVAGYLAYFCRQRPLPPLLLNGDSGMSYQSYCIYMFFWMYVSLAGCLFRRLGQWCIVLRDSRSAYFPYRVDRIIDIAFVADI